MAQATLAAGCFWGVEETFRTTEGVTATSVGYTGGTTENPTYEQVCTGLTGHAEAVLVDFDPDTISFEQVLEIFWACHDPTQLNRQGPDVGTQYRTAIFFHDADQERIARDSLARAQASGKFRREIVTQITPAPAYYPAEDYHQQYFAKRGIRHFGH